MHQQNESRGKNARPLEIIVTLMKGVRFRVFDPKEHIQKFWMGGIFYEASFKGLLAYLNRHGYVNMRCLDIGASIGNHSLYFKCILNCDVIAIEPFKSSFDHLMENCRLNNVEIESHNVALGDHTGMVSMNNVSRKNYNVGMCQVVEGNDVKIDKLDNVVFGQFGFIKIDVEHYNIPLLAGAEKTLRNQKSCHVFIECETDEIKDPTNEIMSDYGYELQDVKLNHTPTYLWIK